MNLITFSGFVLALLCLAEAAEKLQIKARAKADIYLANDYTHKVGEISLIQYYSYVGPTFVAITGELTQIAPAGLHGFHVHENAPDGSCSGMGEHYKPFDKIHGSPDDSERHVGDLGNIESDGSYNVEIDMTDKIIFVGSGDLFDVLGKGIAIDTLEDDFSPDFSSPKLACGVIVNSANLQTLNLFLLVLASLFAVFWQ